MLGVRARRAKVLARRDLKAGMLMVVGVVVTGVWVDVWNTEKSSRWLGTLTRLIGCLSWLLLPRSKDGNVVLLKWSVSWVRLITFI